MPQELVYQRYTISISDIIHCPQSLDKLIELMIEQCYEIVGDKSEIAYFEKRNDSSDRDRLEGDIAVLVVGYGHPDSHEKHGL